MNKGVKMSGKYGAIEQNQVIDKARKRRLLVQVFLKNGTILKGKITKFDLFTILLKSQEEYILIYKHSISTIVPMKSKKTKQKLEKKEKKINDKPKKIFKIQKKKNDL